MSAVFLLCSRSVTILFFGFGLVGLTYFAEYIRKRGGYAISMFNKI